MPPPPAPTVLLTWERPDLPDALSDGEVRVWRAGLEGAARLAALERGLPDAERARAARLGQGDDRARFVTGRALLRERLGRCTGIPPAELAIGETAAGQPRLLAADAGGRQLGFSVSHAGGVVLVAIAAGRDVGVDVEALRPRADLDGLAARFFSPGERDAVRGSADPAATFLTLWTVKEAYLKATGDGLAALHTVTVTLAPGGPILEVAGAPRDESGRWAARTFSPAPGHVAAVVAASAPRPPSGPDHR